MKEIILENAKFIKNENQLLGFVRGDSFRNIDIPFNPNPRHFTGKQNSNYMRMVSTLIHEPDMFTHKNASGITIFANDCIDNQDGSYTILLSDSDGIANGGHTYTALKNFGSAKNFVKVTIEINLDDAKKIDIVESLNLSKKIEQVSLNNKRGVFDWHKELLFNYQDDIIYHEGDSGFVNIRESYGSLFLFTYRLDGSKDLSKQFKQSVQSVFTMMKAERTNERMEQITEIAEDIHDLFVYITTNQNYINAFQIAKKKGARRRLRNGEFGLNIALSQFILMTLAAVGVYLDENKKVRWKNGFQTEALRKSFCDEIFLKIFDTLIVDELPTAKLVLNTDIINKTIKQAEILATMRYNGNLV